MVLIINNTAIPISGNSIIEVRTHYDYGTAELSVVLFIDDYKTKPFTFQISDISPIEQELLEKTIINILADMVYDPISQYSNAKINIEDVIKTAIEIVKGASND